MDIRNGSSSMNCQNYPMTIEKNIEFYIELYARTESIGSGSDRCPLMHSKQCERFSSKSQTAFPFTNSEVSTIIRVHVRAAVIFFQLRNPHRTSNLSKTREHVGA